MARQKDSNLCKMFGRNLAAARELAGLTQSDVMAAIWHETDPKKRNRISEIENGSSASFSIEVLYQLTTLYGVSADYVLGLSVEPEIDRTAGKVGMIYSGVCEIANSLISEMTERVVMASASHIAAMPKPHSLALLDGAKRVLGVMSSTADPLKPSQAQALFGLQCAVKDFDRDMAIQMRNFEMAMFDCVNRPDKEDRHSMASDLNPTIKPRRAVSTHPAMAKKSQVTRRKPRPKAQIFYTLIETSQLSLFILPDGKCVVEPMA